MNPLIIGLIIYSLIILGVGIRAARLNRTLSDYLLADRRLGPWVAAFSERASGESAWLLIGLPGLAFASGFTTVWVGIGCCSGIAFSWFVVARRLREETERVGALTLADYFSARFQDTSHTLRITATAIILFFFTFYVAAQFLAAGKVLNFYLNLPPVVGMLIGAVLVLGVMVAQIVDLQFNWAIEQSTSGLADRTARFGNLFSLVSAVALVFQLLFTATIHRSLGVGFGLRIAPVAMALGAGLVLIFSGLLPEMLLAKTPKPCRLIGPHKSFWHAQKKTWSMRSRKSVT